MLQGVREPTAECGLRILGKALLSTDVGQWPLKPRPRRLRKKRVMNMGVATAAVITAQTNHQE